MVLVFSLKKDPMLLGNTSIYVRVNKTSQVTCWAVLHKKEKKLKKKRITKTKLS